MREVYVVATALYQFAIPMIYLTYVYVKMSIRLSKTETFHKGPFHILREIFFKALIYDTPFQILGITLDREAK